MRTCAKIRAWIVAAAFSDWHGTHDYHAPEKSAVAALFSLGAEAEPRLQVDRGLEHPLSEARERAEERNVRQKEMQTVMPERVVVWSLAVLYSRVSGPILYESKSPLIRH